MKNSALAIILILLAALWRILSAFEPALSNVAPITALAFCGAAYLRDWRWWLVPFFSLIMSDLWLNYYHATRFGFAWSWDEILFRLLCFAAAIGVGRLVARRRNLLTFFGGALASSLLFFVGTNTVAWASDPFYCRTPAGWIQALTVGHPEYPSTLWFFRNTLFGDLLFTGIFVLAVELASIRAAIAGCQNSSV
jgi:hypothetical protein